MPDALPFERLPIIPVCLQERQCAAESCGRPDGGWLFPPAARLRHHCVPHPPSGRDQLRLQVAAIAPRESDAVTHTSTPTLYEH